MVQRKFLFSHLFIQFFSSRFSLIVKLYSALWVFMPLLPQILFVLKYFRFVSLNLSFFFNCLFERYNIYLSIPSHLQWLLNRCFPSGMMSTSTNCLFLQLHLLKMNKTKQKKIPVSHRRGDSLRRETFLKAYKPANCNLAASKCWNLQNHHYLYI